MQDPESYEAQYELFTTLEEDDLQKFLEEIAKITYVADGLGSTDFYVPEELTIDLKENIKKLKKKGDVLEFAEEILNISSSNRYFFLLMSNASQIMDLCIKETDKSMRYIVSDVKNILNTLMDKELILSDKLLQDLE